MFGIESLQVSFLLTLLASGLALLMDVKEKTARIIALFSSLFYLIQAVCGFFFIKVFKQDLYYTFGNWPSDIGIQFKYGLHESMLILSLGAVLLSFCYTIIKHSKPSSFKGIFPFIFFLFTGLTGLVLTNDIFNLYVFLEITAVSSFVIFCSRSYVVNFKNTFDYILVATIGSCFFLIGVCVLYMETGHLNFYYIKTNIQYGNTVYLSYLFILFGFLLKIGVYPFQLIIKNLYYHTSFILMSLMFCVSKVMFFALFKVLSNCFPADLNTHMVSFQYFMRIVALFIVTISAMQTINIKDFKNYLILSFTTSNAFIVLFLFSRLEISVDFVKFLCAEIFAKHLLCLNAVKLLTRSKSDNKISLSCYNFFGIFDKNMITKLYLIVLTISASYLPIGTHFVFKINILMGMIKSGFIVEFIILIIYSLVSLIYVWQLINPVLLSNNGTKTTSSIQEPFFYEIITLVLMMFLFIM